MSSESNAGEESRPVPSSGADGSGDERRTFGPYEIRKKIGAGGMGAVYLAVETLTKRSVALKVLPKEKAANPTLVKRFQSEAQSAAQLKHENIVQIYGAGEIDGYLYIALEYVDGTDIHELVQRRGVLPVRRSVDIVKQVAQALGHAHRQGIVHRDIKPSNLMIRRDGAVKLTDMGLARSVDETSGAGITRAGMTVGTVDYMSPEQAQNSKAADVRSDLYSLGCTWYHMLTGQPPFSKGTLADKLHGHAAEDRPDPRDRNESVPEGVVHVLQKMMAIAPEHRYQSPADLLTDLESPHLTRNALAENLQAALNEDVRTESGGKAPSPSAEQKRTLPPRKKRNRKKKTTSGISADQVKIVGVVVGVIGLVVGLWWLTSKMASVFDSPQVASSRRPSSSGDNPNSTGGAKGDNKGGTASGDDPSQLHVKPPTRRPRPDGGRSTTKPSPSPTVVKTPIPKRLQPGLAGPPIGIERPGERPFFPNWVAATSSQSHPAPQAELKTKAELKTVFVGRTSGGPAQFADLETAFRAAPPQGTVIQLVGDGPFFLPTTTVAHRGTIVVTASSGARPLVVLVPSMKKQTAAVLTVRNSSLAFLGVHLLVDSKRFPPEEKRVLIEVQSGNLTVRNGSVTVRDERDGETVAFRISDSGDQPNATSRRVLIDRVFVRGNRCTVMEITSPAVDVVATNSLFLTGTAPVMRLIPSPANKTITKSPAPRNTVITLAPSQSTKKRKAVSQKQHASTQEDSDSPRRVVRLISCTSVGRKTAFELSADGNPPTSLTDFIVVNSLLATDQIDGQTVLMSLRNWPRDSQPDPEGSLLNRLRWTGRATILSGWKSLLRSGPHFALTADGMDSWQRVWREPNDDDHFQRSPWPATARSPLAAALPNSFNNRSLAANGLKATDGALPGCLVDRLSSPRTLTLQRAIIIGSRPRLANTDPETRKPTTIRIDLQRQDLGKLISAGGWPSGTEFVISGSGKRFSSPIQVRDKSLRIRFQQSAGKPLVILPKHLPDEPSERAFITIRNGHIALSNGLFYVRSSSTKSPVKWLLSVTDGGFSLEHCALVGPMRTSPGYHGLIHWKQTAPQPGDRSSRRLPRRSGRISDSYLTTDRLLLDAEFRHRSLEMNNSVFASLSNLFLLRIVGTEPKIRAAVDARGCTFSAANAVFTVRATPFSKPSVDPLRFFVDESVFLRPVDVGPKRTTHPIVLSCPNLARPQNQIDWWGTGNGYASQLAEYLHSATVRKATVRKGSGSQNFKMAWKTAWGTAHVLRPLSGQRDIFMPGPFPHRTQLTSTDFRLHASCTAFRWSAIGQPIGAKIDRLPKGDMNRLSKSRRTSNKRKKKAPQKKGSANQPDF